MLQDHRRRAIVQRLAELPAVDEVGCSPAETGQRGAGIRCCADFIKNGGGYFSVLLLFLGFGLVGIHCRGSFLVCSEVIMNLCTLIKPFL